MKLNKLNALSAKKEESQVIKNVVVVSAKKPKKKKNVECVDEVREFERAIE
jgi:hypothetical protein